MLVATLIFLPVVFIYTAIVFRALRGIITALARAVRAERKDRRTKLSASRASALVVRLGLCRPPGPGADQPEQ